MPRASFATGRTIAVCDRCRRQYTSNDGWAWCCYECGPDAQAEALVEVTRELADSFAPADPGRTCPHDGCLLVPGERCPACRVRDRARSKYQRLQGYSDTEHDPKRPVAWRLKGNIQVPVYEQQSEVA